LSPVVTAIIMAGRVGSAFAAELGTMQVSRSFYHVGPSCSHSTSFSTSLAKSNFGLSLETLDTVNLC